MVLFGPVRGCPLPPPIWFLTFSDRLPTPPAVLAQYFGSKLERCNLFEDGVPFPESRRNVAPRPPFCLVLLIVAPTAPEQGGGKTCIVQFFPFFLQFSQFSRFGVFVAFWHFYYSFLCFFLHFFLQFLQIFLPKKSCTCAVWHLAIGEALQGKVQV